MVRGFLNDLGILVKYEVKDNEIIQYYSSGKTQVVPFEDSIDRDAYIYMLDDSIKANKNEITRLEIEKDIKEKISNAEDTLLKRSSKQGFKLLAFLAGLSLIPVGFVIGTQIINPGTELMSPVFCGFGIAFLGAVIGGPLIIDDKKSKRIRQEIEAYETDLNDIEEERKEEKELELSKKLEGFNFEKKYEELSKDEYVEGMKIYLANLQKLAESNPELAKEMANKAFVDQGLVEAGIIKEEQPKKLVKKPKKDNKGNN